VLVTGSAVRRQRQGKHLKNADCLRKKIENGLNQCAQYIVKSVTADERITQSSFEFQVDHKRTDSLHPTLSVAGA
jgi:hypothetical protein